MQSVGSCSRQNAYTVLHSAVFYSECNIGESINLFADDSKGQLTESVKNSTFSKNVEQDSKAQQKVGKIYTVDRTFQNRSPVVGL